MFGLVGVDLDDAPHQTTASMHMAAARILLSPNKLLYFATCRISDSCSPSKRTIETPAVRHNRGKNANEALMQSVSETGYLVTVYQCWRRLVKSFFY
jgi:hypothetical protein